MPRTLSFWQVDAFSARPYLGNPAAVVFDADGLTTEEMQRIARQMNLSETVFLLEPRAAEADYRARIFTPKSELPFAGHPTIAAAFAFSSRRGGSRARLVQECGIGMVRVDATEEAGATWFTLEADGEPVVDATSVREDIADALRVPQAAVLGRPAVCSIGARWLIARLDALESVLAASPRAEAVAAAAEMAGAVGLTVYALGAQRAECALHVRTFAPGAGILEDPVCGSGNASVGLHLAHDVWSERDAFDYVAEQGVAVARDGLVRVAVSRDAQGKRRVRIGGQAVRVMHGELVI